MDDVQNHVDERGIPLDRVGVTDLQYPIVVLDQKHEKQHTIARFTMSVNLPHQFKGTHMSRFIEVLNVHHGEFTMRTLPAMLRELKQRLDAEAARVEVTFPYFVEKAAPSSGAKALMDYECSFVGELNGGDVDFVVGVDVPVTSLCPCSKSISDYGAHNQRGVISVAVRGERGADGASAVHLDRRTRRHRRAVSVGSRLSAAQAPGRATRDDAGLRQPGLRRGHGPQCRDTTSGRSPRLVVPRERREPREHPQSQCLRVICVDAASARLQPALPRPSEHEAMGSVSRPMMVAFPAQGVVKVPLSSSPLALGPPAPRPLKSWALAIDHLSIDLCHCARRKAGKPSTI